MFQFLNPVRNFQFLNGVNRKFLILLLAVVLLSQAGFVFGYGDVCSATNPCASSGEECCCDESGEGICGNSLCTNVICPFSKWTNLKDLITAVVDYIFYLAVILVPLMIVIGGFMFLTSGGSQSRTTLGKNIIKWSIIGFAIILFARGIQGIIKYIITGS